MKRALLACAALLWFGPQAAAQTAPAAPKTPPRPMDCKAPDHRQLDFWLGEWRVFNTADNVESSASRIERVLGGCAIQETYEAPKAPGGPYAGSSYSAYDFATKKWRQFYVDTTGAVTHFVGGLEGADMVMSAQGFAGIQRMVYRPQADGSVRQIGTVSTDGGKTWAPGYDYTYRRR